MLNACSADDKYFWTDQKMKPLIVNEEGTFIDGDAHAKVGQYSGFGDIMQKYKGPIKGSIVSTWKVVRLKGGKPDWDKLCGKEPREKNYTSNEITDEYERVKREREENDKITNKVRICVKKHQAINKANEKTHYFYARTTQTHKITYPIKHKRHSHWEAIVYHGRVGDLTDEAIEPEDLANISQFRTHLCTKYGSSVQNVCFDLPGEDKNLYYSIREVKIAKKNPELNGYQPQWESIMDVRISAPTPWTEVEGIEIDKEMYEYLKDECYQERSCHLDDYKGSMTKEQRTYVNKVSWK